MEDETEAELSWMARSGDAARVGGVVEVPQPPGEGILEEEGERGGFEAVREMSSEP